MTEEEIKQIKQTLETWQHIIDFGYGTIEVPKETKIFKTILNLIDKQQKEIEELKHNSISKDKIREVLEKERKKQKERKDIYLALHSQYISLIDKIKKQLLEESNNAK